jgi:hypothetical protein
VNTLCRLCGHPFKMHECGFDQVVWWCKDGNCSCDEFVPSVGSGKDGDEIEVQYDSESYKWN